MCGERIKVSQSLLVWQRPLPFYSNFAVVLQHFISMEVVSLLSTSFTYLISRLALNCALRLFSADMRISLLGCDN